MPREKFRKGSIYESTTHGLVKYIGTDEYFGETTLRFYSITYNKDCYWKPSKVADHFVDEVRFEIAKLDFKPGDMLVVRIIENVTMDEIVRIKQRIEELLSPRINTLVIDKVVELSVISENDKNAS